MAIGIATGPFMQIVPRNCAVCVCPPDAACTRSENANFTGVTSQEAPRPRDGIPARRTLAAVVTLVVGTPVFLWSAIGQLSDEGGTDHLIKVPAINRVLELAIALAALVATVIASNVLRGTGRPWFIEAGWWRVVIRLLAAGAYVAIAGRIITSAVGGANIGGAILLYFVAPLLLPYLLWSSVRQARKLKGAQTSGGGDGRS
jgi:hypothetical protein